MGKVAEELLIPASLAEVWDLYFEPQRWRAWVDEFHAVESISDDFPEVGGKLVWRSGPAGRGQVVETVSTSRGACTRSISPTRTPRASS